MILHTERLVLRNFKEMDISDALEYLSDPEVMKYIEPIFDYEKAKEFINVCGLGQEPLVYALVHKKQNKVIGHIIFHEFNDSNEFELGWIINKQYWGQGFAAEISRELISYGFNVLGLKTIIAEAKEDNIRSIRTIERLGMKKNNGCNENLSIWSISKEEEQEREMKNLKPSVIIDVTDGSTNAIVSPKDGGIGTENDSNMRNNTLIR